MLPLYPPFYQSAYFEASEAPHVSV